MLAAFIKYKENSVMQKNKHKTNTLRNITTSSFL